MKKMFLYSVLVALLASPSMSAIIFEDNFSDGNRDGWFLTNDDAATDLTVSVGGGLQLTDTDGATDNTSSAVASFAAADMSGVGAKITLTLDFQNLENHVLNRGIGIGLYSSENTALTADAADQGGAADDSGWYLYTRRNPALHRMYENNAHGVSYTAGANRANNTTGTFGYADGWHTYKLIIETAADLPGDTYEDDLGLDLVITMICDESLATENIMSYRDTYGLVLNYDEVGVMSMKGNDIEIDNVMVDYVAGVPEPATMVFLGLGGLLMRRGK